MLNKHKVRINIANSSGVNARVLESVTECIPKKLFNKWFGDKKRKVLIIAPAESVSEVEIHEVKADKQGG